MLKKTKTKTKKDSERYKNSLNTVEQYVGGSDPQKEQHEKSDG